jgi:hypothetical protein
MIGAGNLRVCAGEQDWGRSSGIGAVGLATATMMTMMFHGGQMTAGVDAGCSVRAPVGMAAGRRVESRRPWQQKAVAAVAGRGRGMLCWQGHLD